MHDIYDLDPLSPAEQRLLADAIFGGLTYPTISPGAINIFVKG